MPQLHSHRMQAVDFHSPACGLFLISACRKIEFSLRGVPAADGGGIEGSDVASRSGDHQSTFDRGGEYRDLGGRVSRRAVVGETLSDTVRPSSGWSLLPPARERPVSRPWPVHPPPPLPRPPRGLPCRDSSHGCHSDLYRSSHQAFRMRDDWGRHLRGGGLRNCNAMCCKPSGGFGQTCARKRGPTTAPSTRQGQANTLVANDIDRNCTSRRSGGTRNLRSHTAALMRRRMTASAAACPLLRGQEKRATVVASQPADVRSRSR